MNQFIHVFESKSLYNKVRYCSKNSWLQILFKCTKINVYQISLVKIAHTNL